MVKLAGCLALLWTGCGLEPAPGHAVLLGALVDRTGNDSTPSWSDAIGLAVDDMNAALGRTCDQRFRVVYKDTINTPSLAVQKAKDLVAQGAKALLADTSQDHIAVNALNYDPSVMGFGLPIMGFAPSAPSINDPNATDPDPIVQASLRDPDDWSFRTSLASTQQAQILMQIALSRGANGDVDNDGNFKVSIYGSDDPANTGFAAAIATAAAQLHPTPAPIVETLFHPANADVNTYDFYGDVTKLLATDGATDVLIFVDFVLYEVAAQKAFQQTGQQLQQLHIHTFRRVPVLRALVDAANGQEGTSPVLVDATPSGDTFNRELTAVLSSPPDIWDANAYDGTVALMLATLWAGRQNICDLQQVTPVQIRDSLRAINDPAGELVGTGPDELARAVSLIAAGTPINYQGASGPVDFDEHGNVRLRLAHWVVQNDQFVEVEQFDCVQSDACPKIDR